MGKFVNDPVLNSEINAMGYPNLKQAWYRRGVLEAVKEIYGSQQRYEPRLKAMNQRFKEFRLPKKKLGNKAGEILLGKANQRNLKNVADGKWQRLNPFQYNKTQFAQLHAALEVGLANKEARNVFKKSQEKRKTMNAKKAQALLGQPERVAVSLRHPPVNPFTKKNNQGKVVLNLFTRNGATSFVNLPRNIQTKILQNANITVTPNKKKNIK